MRIDLGFNYTPDFEFTVNQSDLNLLNSYFDSFNFNNCPDKNIVAINIKNCKYHFDSEIEKKIEIEINNYYLNTNDHLNNYIFAYQNLKISKNEIDINRIALHVENPTI